MVEDLSKIYNRNEFRIKGYIFLKYYFMRVVVISLLILFSANFFKFDGLALFAFLFMVAYSFLFSFFLGDKSKKFFLTLSLYRMKVLLINENYIGAKKVIKVLYKEDYSISNELYLFQYYVKEIYNFKENLTLFYEYLYNLLSSNRTLKKREINQIDVIIRNIYNDSKELNKSLIEFIGSEETTKIKYFDDILKDLFKILVSYSPRILTNNIFKIILAIIFLGFSSFIMYEYFGISKDTVYLGSVTLLSVFLYILYKK